MFRTDVLQNQWLILALIGGLALVAAMALAYLAFWRPRSGAAGGSAVQDGAAPARPQGTIPWIIILAFAFAAIFVLIYTWMAAVSPPNW